MSTMKGAQEQILDQVLTRFLPNETIERCCHPFSYSLHRSASDADSPATSSLFLSNAVASVWRAPLNRHKSVGSQRLQR